MTGAVEGLVRWRSDADEGAMLRTGSGVVAMGGETRALKDVVMELSDDLAEAFLTTHHTEPAVAGWTCPTVRGQSEQGLRRRSVSRR